MRLVAVATLGMALAGCGGSTPAAGYTCDDVRAAQTNLAAASAPGVDNQTAVGLWNGLSTSLYKFHAGDPAIRAAAAASITASTSVAPDASDLAAVGQALVAASKTCD
jgi:hypothetical protein